MRKGVFVLLIAIGALLGARVWLVFTAPEPELLAYVGRTSVVQGVVADDPDRRATSVRVVLSVEHVNGKEVSGKALVVLPNDERVAYGDHIAVRGALEVPQSFETNAGREFDYANYLKVRGISVVMQHAALRANYPGEWSLRGMLFALKHSFEASLERSIQEPQAALLEGMLLGERGGFPSALLQLFVVVGLIHIVVLSGSNISIVSEAIFRSLSFLPKKLLYTTGLLTIVLFALMTGGGSATARAVIMGAIAILARYLHRTNDALRALAAAAVLMLMWNPLVLLDIGFILSMLATFGLITLGAAIEQKIHWVPVWGINFRSIIATTIAVEILILPALLYVSGVFSFVSLPINALVLPLVPLCMFFGFITGLLGFVHPHLALLPAMLTDAPLRLIVWVATSAASLPFAATTVAPFPAWVAWSVYALLLPYAIWIYRRSAPPAPTN